jgi:gluconate 2-dehydrogenase alpha chain
VNPQAARADVLLIGLGGAGGIAADVLTRAGARVLALEAGPRVGAADAELDEIANDVHGRLSRPKALAEVPTWRSDPSRDAGPSPWPMLMVNAVGGSTVHYPGLSARFHPWNFESRTRTIERYGLAAIPAGSTIADWPLGYAELEPQYEAVERAIGVAGDAGNIGGALTGAGSHFEGPRASAYPMPPLRRSGWTELTDAAARTLGWHPFAAPAAINSVPFNGNPECTYCGFCSGNSCYRDAKGSTDANVIARAEQTGLLTVVTGARVTRLEVDRDGLISGAHYVKDGRECFAPASFVLLATFTYENVRLLLLSSSKQYPRGLSNNHGQVGRHYMAHVTPFVFGLFPGRRLNLFSGLWSQATCVDDWNADNFDHSGLGFIGGALLAAPQELKPIAAASGPLPASVPRWGSAWKAWLKANAQSVGYLSAQVESLSYEENFLDLDPTARDPFGLPVVRVTHRARANEQTSAAFMIEKLRTWLQAAGASETWHAERLAVEARHCYGGTRMGDDAEHSVVDRFGFSHEAPNLGILGTSTFPTTGGHNPTLTLQALAWRTAERLVELSRGH